MSKSDVKILWIEDNDAWLDAKIDSISESFKEVDIDFDHYPLDSGKFLKEHLPYYPNFNIAVVDYGLEGLNGVQVVKEILDFKKDCKIILYSFDESIDLRSELMTALNAQDRVLGIFNYTNKKEVEEVIIELAKQIKEN